jgi:hypothetical protein
MNKSGYLAVIFSVSILLSDLITANAQEAIPVFFSEYGVLIKTLPKQGDTSILKAKAKNSNSFSRKTRVNLIASGF